MIRDVTRRGTRRVSLSSTPLPAALMCLGCFGSWLILVPSRFHPARDIFVVTRRCCRGRDQGRGWVMHGSVENAKLVALASTDCRLPAGPSLDLMATHSRRDTRAHTVYAKPVRWGAVSSMVGTCSCGCVCRRVFCIGVVPANADGVRCYTFGMTRPRPSK